VLVIIILNSFCSFSALSNLNEVIKVPNSEYFNRAFNYILRLFGKEESLKISEELDIKRINSINENCQEYFRLK
jgi:hypothetical protein